MAYKPIEDYGVIGNMRTAALVGRDGAIDWLCWPYFDSPSVFGAILDHRKGGTFRISATEQQSVPKQLYWPDTNILVTRFLSPGGVGEVIDFMPVDLPASHHLSRSLVRIVGCARGRESFDVECRPAFDYARATHVCQATTHGARFAGAGLELGLSADVPLQCDGVGASARVSLNAGERRAFVLQDLGSGSDGPAAVPIDEALALFHRAVQYWRRWLARCTYAGRWRETIHRSALVLKLLTFEPTGAIVSAPTCSLPEHVGGERNWDYRYTWIRDAAFTLYALMRIGFTEEASAFITWLEARCQEAKDVGLQVIYGIDGRHDLPERTLDHLEGYRGSRPVRIGNDGVRQLQLDIYGEVLDSVYLFNKHGRPISFDLWRAARQLVDWVCENWQREDESIWEVRGGRRHFVFSKLMCWVAVDRGVRLAEKRSFPADHERWRSERDRMFLDIMERGWSQSRNAFVQYYGGDALDASLLLMPLVFFLSPSDPRMLRTIDVIRRPVWEGGLMLDGAVYRYDPQSGVDGLPGVEGSFNMCTFWLVEALTRAGQFDRPRLEEARLLFEQMLGFANHLGLYAEETGPSGEALGNFPQAFTHLALISAGVNLDRALGVEEVRP